MNKSQKKKKQSPGSPSKLRGTNKITNYFNKFPISTSSAQANGRDKSHHQPNKVTSDPDLCIIEDSFIEEPNITILNNITNSIAQCKAISVHSNDSFTEDDSRPRNHDSLLGNGQISNGKRKKSQNSDTASLCSGSPLKKPASIGSPASKKTRLSSLQQSSHIIHLKDLTSKEFQEFSQNIDETYASERLERKKKEQANANRFIDKDVEQIPIHISSEYRATECEIVPKLIDKHLEIVNNSQNLEVLEKSPSKDSSTNIMNNMLNDSWDETCWEVPDYTLDLHEWKLCTILEISKSAIGKELVLRCTKSNAKTACVLAGQWKESKLEEGATINIKAVRNIAGSTPFIVDNDSGLLVYESGQLISGTSVVGALFCQRRAILSTNFKPQQSDTSLMIIGSLVHRLFQSSLRGKLFAIEDIKRNVAEMLRERNVNFSLYQNNMELKKVQTELETFVPKIHQFMVSYVQKNPSGCWKRMSNFGIDSVEDIEENIWCPTLGLKGKVDVTIRRNKDVLPLELKTGRASGSAEHRGQVMLYTMMMRQMGYDTSRGFLAYLRENVVQEITFSHREERDLTMLRNELVYYLSKKVRTQNDTILPPELPGYIDSYYTCSKCPYNTVCCALVEDEIAPNHPLKSVKTDKLEHLTQKHLNYFIHWCSLVFIESSYKNKSKELLNIYTLSPEEREKRGKTLINMNLFGSVLESGPDYIHVFKRNDADVKKSGLTNGSYLIISTDSRAAVAIGFVTNITDNTLSISLERDLSKKYKNVVFHLDTYESNVYATFNLSNLALLLENNERADLLRKFIIDHAEPKFDETLPKTIVTAGKSVLSDLNKFQMQAVMQALTADNYFLIKGMPGTGKTATIISIVKMLIIIGKSVLITSHTHSAIDNVCIKLKIAGISVLRLGSESRIDPSLKDESEYVRSKNFTTPQEFEDLYNKAQVIAVTCLGANHPALMKRTLDVCIVDESTQVLQPSILRVLLSCKKFILVGDPDQLPPVVRNPEAVQRGMGASLFSRLQIPSATITLTHQYRMNATITNLANVLTYGGQLKTATNEVASSVLQLNDYVDLRPKDDWLKKILSCELEDAVILVDTGAVWQRNDAVSLKPSSLTDREHGSCYNVHEAALTFNVVQKLLESDVDHDSIGIITPYRAQVDLLQQLIKLIDINTVDQFQGRDKDVIIYSCTKSVDESIQTREERTRSFEILENQCRLTVAVTRAKVKLIIIGDVSTLNRYTPFVKLFRGISEKQRVLLKDRGGAFSWTDLLKDVY